MESRTLSALKNPGSVQRFGGLSLGESTHLVNEVEPLDSDLQSSRYQKRTPSPRGQAFLLAPRGHLTLPVWVDHVGSADTRYVTGDLMGDWPAERQPEFPTMPRIEPLDKP